MKSKILKITLISTITTILGSTLIFADNNMLSFSNLTQKNNLPSASGIDYLKESIYVIGDDSPYLFKLDKNFNITDKLLIKNYETNSDGRIPKAIKPDYEAFEILEYKGTEHALILGSGSKDVRMYGYLINLDTKEKIEFNLKDFYDILRNQANFPSDTPLNIEGVALADNKLILLNRGNSGDNIIFSIDEHEFLNYVEKHSNSFKSIKSYKVSLPNINGNIAGLSGVDYLEDEDALVLTASVEVTNDPINDGKILGSYIGAIKMDSLRNNLDLTNKFHLITDNNSPYITKAESITIHSYKNEILSGSVASDNDDGSSEFFNFKLNLDQ